MLGREGGREGGQCHDTRTAGNASKKLTLFGVSKLHNGEGGGGLASYIMTLKWFGCAP